MAVLSHQANVYWYVQYDKLWIQAHPLARITKGPKMMDVKDIIISQYMAEIQPYMDEMEKILMFSIPSIIVNKSGIKRVYDDETKNKIDMLNRQIELIRNNYKSQHPELLKYI